MLCCRYTWQENVIDLFLIFTLFIYLFMYLTRLHRSGHIFNDVCFLYKTDTLYSFSSQVTHLISGRQSLESTFNYKGYLKHALLACFMCTEIYFILQEKLLYKFLVRNVNFNISTLNEAYLSFYFR